MRIINVPEQQILENLESGTVFYFERTLYLVLRNTGNQNDKYKTMPCVNLCSYMIEYLGNATRVEVFPEATLSIKGEV